MSKKPRICIVTPARPEANNGNWHTAARWQRFLAPIAAIEIVQSWQGNGEDTGPDALIALHAWRSAGSIERFHTAHPERPLALVLTGTDLYRDLGLEAGARHALKCASQLVVLQEEALSSLAAEDRVRARVIEQSATQLIRHDQATRSFDFVAVGHLREVKDPLTLMAAARLLPADSLLRVLHIGAALEQDLAEAAERTMAECAPYRWLGGLPAKTARRWMARSRALVHMSRMEGGANVVIEAIRSRVPVLASRIDGNLGLLGRDYAGYFPPGDAQALAALMQRFAHEPAFAAHLAAQCAAREPRFTPAAEAGKVRALLSDLFASRADQPLPKSLTPHLEPRP